MRSGNGARSWARPTRRRPSQARCARSSAPQSNTTRPTARMRRTPRPSSWRTSSADSSCSGDEGGRHGATADHRRRPCGDDRRSRGIGPAPGPPAGRCRHSAGPHDRVPAHRDLHRGERRALDRGGCPAAVEGQAGRRVQESGVSVAIKSDRWIRRMALEHKMIEPFVDEQVRSGVVSFGLSSYGYDIRVADEFKVFTNINNTVIDPKNFDPRSFVDIRADVCIVPPNSFALARTIEYFRIPRDVLTVCLGKSTYARCGIIVNVTPFEPEWEGTVTLEISNTTPLPAKIYANEGIAQVLFFQSDEPCERSYADKAGKYLKQRGVTLPKV